MLAAGDDLSSVSVIANALRVRASPLNDGAPARKAAAATHRRSIAPRALARSTPAAAAAKARTSTALRVSPRRREQQRGAVREGALSTYLLHRPANADPYAIRSGMIIQESQVTERALMPESVARTTLRRSVGQRRESSRP